MVPQFSQFYNQKIEAQNIPSFGQPVEKIKLVKNNIKLQFYYAGQNQYGYKCAFIVHIITPQYNPMFTQIRASTIDMNSLKQAILDNVDPYDRKYMMLNNFSTNKAEFYFNWEKWVADAMRGVEPKKYNSIFSRSIKMGAPTPRMILSDSIRSGFVKFIQKRLKDYFLRRKLAKRFLIPILPKDILDKIRMSVYNIYDYEYDIQYNTLFIKLKSEFVIAATLLLGKTIKDLKKQKVDFNNPDFFTASVKNNLKNNSQDWNNLFGFNII